MSCQWCGMTQGHTEVCEGFNVNDPGRRDTVILCFDNGLEECQLCGGWLHAGDPPEVPEGEPGIAGKYCSQDCHDEAVKLGWTT